MLSLQSMNLIVQSGSTIKYIITDEHLYLNQQQSVTIQIILQKNTHLDLYIILTNIKDCSINLDIKAQDEKSFFNCVVLYALSDNQNIRINTLQQHDAIDTTSSMVLRGIVKDRASLIYTGLISLLPMSSRANANLRHTTIVMSDTSKVISVPSIEVSHHDVQCSHGTAIGQFRKAELWYLHARGFEKKQAYTMLVRSFFRECLINLALKEDLLERLCQKII